MNRSNREDAGKPAPGQVRVWAPTADRIDLHLPGKEPATYPMRSEHDGMWVSPVTLPHGTDYAFAVDGGEPRPDPRSPWQPAGVHGPSRVFDTGRHPWTDDAWPGHDVRATVIYELHVGTFTDGGTLDSAVDRLGHLVDLGVSTVELMPLAPFPGTHGWGYDGVAPYAVHEPYGGPAALQRFVDAAHARGLAVCLDVVYNHLGPSGNYLGLYGPYFNARSDTPWGQSVNFDGPGSQGVRAFVIDNALRWFTDFHIDALRLDAVHALEDTSPRHVLAELSDSVAALAATVGRPLSLIAESDLNDPQMVIPTSIGGMGMTAQWDDDVHHSVHALLTGERRGYYTDFGSMTALATALTRVFVHDGGWSTFRKQTWGSPVPDDIDGHRFVVFASSHDQVGNRPYGDRLSATLDSGSLAIAAAVILCSPFTPMLFMGEEWGASTPWQFFTDHSDAELAATVRTGRLEGILADGWADVYGEHLDVPDPQALSTFRSSRLDWSEPLLPNRARILAWYRDLIRLRAHEPDIASGDRSTTHVRSADDSSWLVLQRGSIQVAANLSDAPAHIPFDRQAPAGAGLRTDVLAAWEPITLDDTGVTLPARCVAVLRSGDGTTPRTQERR